MPGYRPCAVMCTTAVGAIGLPPWAAATIISRHGPGATHTLVVDAGVDAGGTLVLFIHQHVGIRPVLQLVGCL